MSIRKKELDIKINSMVDVTSEHIFQAEHFCHPERLCRPEHLCHAEFLYCRLESFSCHSESFSCHPESLSCHPERKRRVSSVSFIPNTLNGCEDSCTKGHPEGKARGLSAFIKKQRRFLTPLRFVRNDRAKDLPRNDSPILSPRVSILSRWFSIIAPVLYCLSEFFYCLAGFLLSRWFSIVTLVLYCFAGSLLSRRFSIVSPSFFIASRGFLLHPDVFFCHPDVFFFHPDIFFCHPERKRGVSYAFVIPKGLNVPEES